MQLGCNWVERRQLGVFGHPSLEYPNYHSKQPTGTSPTGTGIYIVIPTRFSLNTSLQVILAASNQATPPRSLPVLGNLPSRESRTRIAFIKICSDELTIYLPVSVISRFLKLISDLTPRGLLGNLEGDHSS